MSYNNYSTKSERREQKRNKKKMFTESGRSAKLWQEIINKRTEEIIRKQRQEKQRNRYDTDDSESV